MEIEDGLYEIEGSLLILDDYGQQDLNPQGSKPLGPKPSVSTNSTMSAAIFLSDSYRTLFVG